MVNRVGQGSQDDLGFLRGQSKSPRPAAPQREDAQGSRRCPPPPCPGRDNLGVACSRETPSIDHRHVQFVDPGGVHQCKRGIDVEVACAHGSQRRSRMCSLFMAAD